MFDLKELYWAAGFIEGEGSFYGKAPIGLNVTVFQNEPEPLERLMKLFGGKVRKDRTGYCWGIYGIKARGVAPLMSLRRKNKIRNILMTWRIYPRRGELRMRKDKAIILAEYDAGSRDIYTLARNHRMQECVIYRWLKRREMGSNRPKEAVILH
ncbi:MAG: hypothetical protein ACRD5H_01520 [Nitrososphaerales archaeon]